MPYAQGVANCPPTFVPWFSLAYSNDGFTLLGLAMANATGRAVGELYQDHILDPLAMASTFSDPPPTTEYTRSVIVGAPWEIIRHVSPTNKVTDLYTKSGHSGLYSGSCWRPTLASVSVS